jgi:hypothetical protein
MKIVGIGLNKTGTTSLGVCLKHWGLRHISYDLEAFEFWRQGDWPAVLRCMEAHDSFEDWPWPLLYREIDTAFPGSKFILTRRKDPRTWFESLCKHADRTGPTDFRKPIYGYEMPHGQDEAHIRFYLAHNEAVRDYFKDRPNDFLEVCWEDGDGWAELAAFLGFEAPDWPFPHVNKSPTPWMKMKRLLARYGVPVNLR